MALDELKKEIHMVPRFGVPGNWTQFGAFDWGYQHPWVFGHYAVNEDGVIFKVNTYTGRLQSDNEIAETIRDRVDVSKLRYIVAGHDCWSTHKARRDDTTPSTADRFAEHDIYLSRANIARAAGLKNLREQVAWKGQLPGGKDGEPNFFLQETVGNEKCFDTLESMIVNPDDPEDALKVNADPVTGEGGDDAYDEVRYALASRPERAKSLWDDQEVRAFDKSVLIYEMVKRRHTSSRVLPDHEDFSHEDVYTEGLL